MNSLVSTLDGTGKAPRPIQLDYLTHLQARLATHNVHGLSGPPGIGKSFLARTIQRTIPNTAIITINNQLVDQYCETYPLLNGLKGKDFYDTPEEYKLAKSQAATSPTVFNPLSFYYYYLRNPSLIKPTTIVIDEAHKLGDMLLLTAARNFNCRQYGIPLGLSELEFMRWLSDTAKSFKRIFTIKSPTAKQEQLMSRCESLILLHSWLGASLHKVKISYQMVEDYRGRSAMCLVVEPLELPTKLLSSLFGDAKLILMSGTLNKFYLEELFPDQVVDFKQYEPVADITKCPIYITPLSHDNRKNMKQYANSIIDLYKANGRPNTLVHLTYADAPIVVQMMRSIDPTLPITTHTKDTKQQQVEVFKQKGGIFLASGMAEGVDLPHGLCRLIIIPRLFFPNLGDVAVMKRQALPTGKRWYEVQTMMTTVQQIGRGVRGEDDWCVTYILDCQFARLFHATKPYLTAGFIKSVHFQESKV